MDDARIARRAAVNRGVFTDADLDEFGVAPNTRRARVRRGLWRRLHEGVYAAGGVPDSFELHATAALAALSGSALSHRAAASVLALSVAEPVLEVSVPLDGTNRLPGVRLYQAALPSHHVTVRDGYRVTTVERTLVDLGRVLNDRELLRCIEDALVARRTTLARVERVFGELAGRGRPGIARTRRVLARLDDSPPTESELEAMFLRLVERYGLPVPVGQARLPWLGRGTGRVDFWFAGPDVVVELDGRRFHLRQAAFESDRRRDLAALAAGVRTVRITHRQLTSDPAGVARQLREVFAGSVVRTPG